MNFQVGQYLAEQRQMSTNQGNSFDRDRERNRDRDRRKDRREYDRDRGRDRDRNKRRDSDRGGYDNNRDRERSRDTRFSEYNPEEGGQDVNNLKPKDNSYLGSSHSSVGSSESAYSDYKDREEHSRGSYEDDYQDYGELDFSEGAYMDKATYEKNYGADRTTKSSTSHDTHHTQNEERGGEKWMTDTPSNTILLRGLPQTIDDKDIRAELMLFGAPIKEVRLMKRKDTGASRGFAFVEFQSVQDAQNWMDHNQGQLLLLNQFTVSMYYSTPRSGGGDRGQQDLVRTDWTCVKCGAHNFKRRDYCFKCSIPREESVRAKEGDGFEHVGNNPCNTLILRGLDALTTEENIIAAVNSLTTKTVKNIRIVRDAATGTSQGYAFVEMSSIRDSTETLDVLKLQEPFEVDGKAILASFAKNTFTTVIATLNQTLAPGQTWDYTQTSEYSAYYTQTSTADTTATTATTGYYDEHGKYYDPTTGQVYDPVTGTYTEYATYYAQHGFQVAAGQPAAPPPATSTTITTTASGKTIQTDTTNAAAAVAQAAIQQAQAVKQYQKQQEEMQKQIMAQMHHQQKLAEMTPDQRLAHQAQEWSQHVKSDAAEYPKYAVPDVSTYQYDESSGYYYDPSTTLYYDPNSQYYYNAQTGQFLYWDGEKSTYLPAPDGEDGTGKKEDSKTKKEKEKKEKVKIAKKIAKDMEKWAKTLNAQKEAMKEGFKKPIVIAIETPQQRVERESATADAGFAILEKRAEGKKPKEDRSLMPPPPMPGGQQPDSKPGLVASYGGDSDEEEPPEGTEDGQVEEQKFADWTKMACLLCKRQFPSKEGLQRHVQLSDLHKNNLETFRKAKGKSSRQQAAGLQYRDRAKERREKFGVPEPPQPKVKKTKQVEPVPFEQPTKSGLGGENIGNKMLQKMGWSEGQGLGRKGQGITDPITANRRNQSAGLGARGSNYNAEPGDSYKDTVKKMMFARYHELE